MRRALAGNTAQLPLADGTGNPVLLDDLVTLPLAGRLADAVVGVDGGASGGRPN